MNVWWGDRPLKPSIPRLIPRQIGELRSELDLGPGVSCADREGVGDGAKHHCFSSSAVEGEALLHMEELGNYTLKYLARRRTRKPPHDLVTGQTPDYMLSN